MLINNNNEEEDVHLEANCWVREIGSDHLLGSLNYFIYCPQNTFGAIRVSAVQVNLKSTIRTITVVRYYAWKL